MDKNKIIAIGVLVVVIIIIIIILITSQKESETMEEEAPQVDFEIEEFNEEVPDLPTNWEDEMKQLALDPETIQNHKEWVRDVKVLSSGAGYSNVDDSNNTPYFTNYIGLSRPRHVPQGSTARTIVDVDESVLQRRRPFIIYY